MTEQNKDPNQSTSDGLNEASIDDAGGDDKEAARRARNSRKRYAVALELTNSEGKFPADLKLITTDFLQFIQNANTEFGRPVIEEAILETILGGLPILKTYNEEFFEKLQERLLIWEESPKISDIFITYGPFLKDYAKYIQQLAKNTKLLEANRRTNLQFNRTMIQFEGLKKCKKLKLEHYLLTPYQRIAKYPLLLEEYMQALDENMEEYEEACMAVDIAKDVARHANRAVHWVENNERMLELEGRLPEGESILETGRYLIIEAKLEKVCRKTTKPRVFALMSDVLVVFGLRVVPGCKKDLFLKYKLSLSNMSCSLPDRLNADRPYEFTVISVKKSFSLVASSLLQRDSWIAKINDAAEDHAKRVAAEAERQNNPKAALEFQVQQFYEKGKTAPVYIPDSNVTMCQVCFQRFWFFVRRHHCRACGAVMCYRCSGKAPLEYRNMTSSLVCSPCRGELVKDSGVDVPQNAILQSVNQVHRKIANFIKKLKPNANNKENTKIQRKSPSPMEWDKVIHPGDLAGYLQWREAGDAHFKKGCLKLTNGVLYCYAAPDDPCPKITLTLGKGSQVKWDEKDPTGNDCFQIRVDRRQKLLCKASDSDEAERWVTAIREVIDQ